MHVLYLHGPGRNVISTRTVPVRTLAHMKGLVLRASGGATTTISALGATPRAMQVIVATDNESKKKIVLIINLVVLTLLDSPFSTNIHKQSQEGDKAWIG